MLRLWDYQVIQVHNNAKGLNTLNQKPDLIWLDLYSPNLDGLEFLDRLRTMPTYDNISIIIVTVSRGKDKITRHLSGVNVVAHFIKFDATLVKIVDEINRIFF